MTAGPRSEALFRRAREVLPGGVSSPVRAFRAVGGTPPVIVRGAGAEVEDADGRRYLDFVGSWGPLILGHAHPEVVAAVQEAAARGLTFGAPTPAEIELAARLVAAYPGLEQVRFVSSGTEAVMSALRLARAVTGRPDILKFTGTYHGHADPLLVAAGSGAATFGHPSSAGVPPPFTAHTRLLPLDEPEAARELLRREGERIAAVILEPVPANHGLLLQTRAFLETLREETRRAGTLLLFDEVITGFRLGPGGAAAHYGIEPDLVTFGKVIGGGLPVGAFGGPRRFMEALAPLGPVYQAGTLSGNPVAMAAGLSTLRVLEREDGWARLEALGAELEERLRPVLARAAGPVRLVRLGSIFWFVFDASTPPRAAEAVPATHGERYRRFFHGLLARGIALPPSGLEVAFLSLAHTSAHLEQFARAVAEALAEVWEETA